MMEFCVDPSTLDDWRWMACYLTTPKHQAFYLSFAVVMALAALAAPMIMVLGFAGALARRSALWPLRGVGLVYTNMVRGVPDVIFFLFVPIALDQGLELLRHAAFCPNWTEPIYRGNDFAVCPEAKLPLGPSAEWVHDLYGFALALIAYAVVFGAFAANTIDGALRAVPRAQLEAASAYGMSPRQIFWRIHLPQMWRYALPGLSNLWMIFIKATPLLFLLGIEDIVYWARELGGSKTSLFQYPHPDWRVWYFLALLVFYLGVTAVSERVFATLTRRAEQAHAPRPEAPSRGRRVGLFRRRSRAT